MTKPDTALIAWQDLPAALGLLSRIPVRIDVERAQARGAAAAWAYPIVGILLGALMIVLAGALGWAGVPAAVIAMLVIASSIIITGAMHEDGLADSADGLWGGWDKARRLEIMKDSRIGAYGVLALVLAIGLRWTCLSVLLADPLWVAALLIPGTLSRAAMVAVMLALPNARVGGLSGSVGRPSRKACVIAIGIGVIMAVLLLGLAGVWVMLIGAIAALACAAIANRKIGGQTGDILGATQQVTEIAVLVTLASLAA
ncbi:MAG: adenosylcobinamide-GDP ribazoletransferase [Pseudomonadota bacterium]